MRRWMAAALLGLLLLAGRAPASGLLPGGVGLNVNANFKWGNNSPSGVLGPWYLYWPYEAHFITPAHPQFAYWPSPQTLAGGASASQQPCPVPVPSYWK